MEFKKGELIEVSQSYYGGGWHRRIFIGYIKGARNPYVCVSPTTEFDFKAGKPFDAVLWPRARKIKPNLKVDDKVLVWDAKSLKKYKRYFKGWNKDDKIVCFSLGTTSWSAENENTWDYWELPE